MHYGGQSVALTLANLQTVDHLFHGRVDGQDGPGLDDYLVELEAGDLSTNIGNQLAAATAAVEKLPDPLANTIVQNPSSVQAAYDELQKMIVLLKVEMPSRMSVLINYQDSDGD